MTLPSNIDSEVRKLCEAMNALPGIETIESCCGHGARPLKVWFYATSLKALPRLIYYLSSCHSGAVGWTCKAITDCGMSPVKFLVESGDMGQLAYNEARTIAALLRREVRRAKADVGKG